MSKKTQWHLSRFRWKIVLLVALVLVIGAICLNCVHISGAVYSLSHDRVVGQANLWIWNGRSTEDKGQGLYLLSMEIPGQNIVIRNQIMKQTWPVYESDLGNTLVIPVYAFLDNEYKPYYVSVYADRTVCVMPTENDVLIWSADETDDLNDIILLWN